MKRKFPTTAIILLFALIILASTSFFQPNGTAVVDLDYSEFYQHLEKQDIQEALLVDQKVEGVLADGRSFSTIIPESEKSHISQLLLKSTDKFKIALPPEPPWWTSLLSTLFMFALFMFFWFFVMQQGGAGSNTKVMSFGKSRARMQQESEKKVTFDDVAGYEEVKEELTEVVEFLKFPKRFLRMGARIPKGILLVGPPGTGKTYMAKAVAGEAGVPFFSISGSDFVEMFVGVGASRVRDLFENAKKSSPCIVFIDEIDAVGRQRGAGLGGGHDEREQTLNQLLVEMDGFEVNEGIIILAATNRPDILDPALLRPGRFDRQVFVDRPDVREREAILNVHIRGKPLEDEIDLLSLAKATPGFTAADLENLVNEAALLSARKSKDKIDMTELEEAIHRVMAGPAKKSKVVSEKEKRLSAFHEAGHAVVAHVLPDFDPVHTVTIVPRGRAGGFTAVLPEEDRYYHTKKDILNTISYALGGRAAEELVFDEVSTGATNDLERVTDLAHKLVTEFGMSEKLGPVNYSSGQNEVFLGRSLAQGRTYSPETAHLIDTEVAKVINTGYQQATEILKEHRRHLDALANLLLVKETVKGDELRALFADLNNLNQNLEVLQDEE